jgi:hypothetical protein
MSAVITPKNPNGIGDTVKLKEIEREIKMRLRVYPGLVSGRKMTKEAADLSIAVMRAIANDYRRLLGLVEEPEPKITVQPQLF